MSGTARDDAAKRFAAAFGVNRRTARRQLQAPIWAMLCQDCSARHGQLDRDVAHQVARAHAQRTGHVSDVTPECLAEITAGGDPR
jgi:hypothetical protein